MGSHAQRWRLSCASWRSGLPVGCCSQRPPAACFLRPSTSVSPRPGVCADPGRAHHHAPGHWQAQGVLCGVCQPGHDAPSAGDGGRAHAQPPRGHPAGGAQVERPAGWVAGGGVYVCVDVGWWSGVGCVKGPAGAPQRLAQQLKASPLPGAPQHPAAMQRQPHSQQPAPASQHPGVQLPAHNRALPPLARLSPAQLQACCAKDAAPPPCAQAEALAAGMASLGTASRAASGAATWKSAPPALRASAAGARRALWPPAGLAAALRGPVGLLRLLFAAPLRAAACVHACAPSTNVALPAPSSCASVCPLLLPQKRYDDRDRPYHGPPEDYRSGREPARYDSFHEDRDRRGYDRGWVVWGLCAAS